MAYWAAARLHQHHERLVLHLLAERGFEVYAPRIRKRRVVHGRKTLIVSSLFPSYCFVRIVLQWSAARWCPGVLGLIMGGASPARVPDAAIDSLREREVNGFVTLPSRAPTQVVLHKGDRVRVRTGVLLGFRGLVAGLAPHERVRILLQLFGGLVLPLHHPR